MTLSPRQIVVALNREATRTNGQHPADHVIFADGVPYAVPRRQWGRTHAESGAPFALPRATEATLAARRLRAKPGWTRCMCAMCAVLT